MTRTSLRLLILGGLALCLSGPAVGFAQTGQVNGKIKAVDANKGIVTLVVPKDAKKKETVEKDFPLADDAAVTLYLDGKFHITTGKEALKRGALKAGMSCSFRADSKGTITRMVVSKGTSK
jgi:hypothetical protein